MWVAKRMEAMRDVCLASRSNTTEWSTVDRSRKTSGLYKVGENGQCTHKVGYTAQLFSI